MKTIETKKGFVSILLIILLGIAIIGGGTFAYLETRPKPAEIIEEVVTSAPIATSTPEIKEEPSITISATTTASTTLKAPVLPVSKPIVISTVSNIYTYPLQDWEIKIDAVLREDAYSEESDLLTCKKLIALYPSLPIEGKAEVAQHLANLLTDENFYLAHRFLLNEREPQDVLDVFMTDLYNRDDRVKLPLFLEIAKNKNHPFQEEAYTDLQIYLDADYGTNWDKWDTELQAYLKVQYEEYGFEERD